jgi:imidazole glycerol phosphate synthase, glutamine amidotransferase subunit
MIAVLDYGVCNIGSLCNMLKKIGQQAIVVRDREGILGADKLVLPGVGAFDAAMSRLLDMDLASAIREAALEKRIPILGICLGMQLLTRESEEGRLPGLGLIDAKTVRFRSTISSPSLRIPHMGWNRVHERKRHPLLTGLDGARFYFVHSYRVECANQEDVLASTDYGEPFTSAFAKDNILGVQFHPEKSHRFGMQLLRNFGGLR